LIGASIGLGARAGGAYVVGYDPSADALAQARSRGAVDAFARDLDELAELADTLILAGPLDAIISAIARLEGVVPSLERAPRLIVDVASLKVPVVSAARGLANFVGTHPWAGSETSGALGARASLFLDCLWSFVPSGSGEPDGRARTLIEALGGRPAAIGAAAHDAAAALTSQLPQVAATALGAMLCARLRDPAAGRQRGPGLRGALRLAGSSWSMWRPLLRENAAELTPLVRELSRSLEELAAALERRDEAALRGAFEQANEAFDVIAGNEPGPGGVV
jgi:prephenate dehydrogenase